MSRTIVTSIGADDGELDVGVLRAAQLIDGLVYGEPLHRFVIELGDDVIRHDAGFGGRSIVDRRDDLDQAVLHRDLDAETAELTARLHLHVAEAVRIHVTRMRIKAGQHAVDGRFDELAVVGLFDIVGTLALEYVAEQIELPISVRCRRTCGRTHQECARLRQQQCRHGADQRTKENQGSFAHHPRTFSPSLVAHYGLGSMGAPSLRCRQSGSRVAHTCELGRRNPA